VKIIAPLLPHLKPGLGYRVIVMERDMGEILKSQERMLEGSEKARAGRPPRDLAGAFADRMAMAKNLLTRSGIPALYIRYVDCITHPDKVSDQVNAFLGGSLDVRRMWAVVRPGLYRERGE
jgi:hypothetical protein